MIFTNLEKYVFQKVLKTTTSTPHPSIQQSGRYFRAESVTWLRLCTKCHLAKLLTLIENQPSTEAFFARRGLDST